MRDRFAELGQVSIIIIHDLNGSFLLFCFVDFNNLINFN